MIDAKQLETKIKEKTQNKFISGVVFKVKRLEASKQKDRVDIVADLKVKKKSFLVAIKVKDTQKIAILRETIRRLKNQVADTNMIPVIAGRFFGERARQVIKEENVGMFDLAGNFYFDREGVYIEKVVDKNPYVKKSPLKQLFAPVSSRITRALLVEPQRKWLQKELSEETGASLGQTNKVIQKMFEEELVKKNREGKVILLNPTVLLSEWKKVYANYEQKKYTFYSYKKDFTELLSLLCKQAKKQTREYALSFFAGAEVVTSFVRGMNKLQFYVRDFANIQGFKEALELEGVEKGANVEIYLPYDEGVFYKPQILDYKFINNVQVVSNVQLYMDLFDNPRRGSEQAKHLRELKLKY